MKLVFTWKIFHFASFWRGILKLGIEGLKILLIIITFILSWGWRPSSSCCVFTMKLSRNTNSFWRCSLIMSQLWKVCFYALATTEHFLLLGMLKNRRGSISAARVDHGLISWTKPGLKSSVLVRWIVIYQVNCAFQRLNNRLQDSILFYITL